MIFAAVKKEVETGESKISGEGSIVSGSLLRGWKSYQSCSSSSRVQFGFKQHDFAKPFCRRSEYHKSSVPLLEETKINTAATTRSSTHPAMDMEIPKIDLHNMERHYAQ